MLPGLFDAGAPVTGAPALSVLALQVPAYRCEALVRQGLQALEGARHNEAFLSLGQACALQPERADLRALLGHCLEQLKAHPAHHAFTQASLNRFPTEPRLRQQFWRASARMLSPDALRTLIHAQLPDIEDPAELNQTLALLAKLPDGNGPVGVVRHDAQSNVLSGWAVDLGDPKRQLSLELYAARPGARNSANPPRTRLAEVAIKGGQGKFQIALPQPFDALDIAIAGHPAATPLCGSPIAAVAPIAAPAPNKRDPAGQPVHVLIPVYKGLERTLACIDSVLAARARNRTRHRILVLDDASPDPALAKAIQARAQRGQLEYVRRPANLGFIRNMNRGMAAAPSSDVVWLNADSLVHGDWLDRLRAAAYTAEDVASATPWSNNGELTSFPEMRHAAPMPTAERLAVLDQAASQVTDEALELEVGCGFCLFIKRRALEQVGYLDEVELRRGYGEETDWCLRARSMGWRHVAATRVFVAHAGGCSFGMEKALRVEQNNRVLRRRHPDAEARFDTFVARDPLAPARRALQAALNETEAATTEHQHTSRPLKSVSEAGKTRQKWPRKRSLRAVNEHSEGIFNAVLATQVVFQRPASESRQHEPKHTAALPQLPGHCWLIADRLDNAALGERWLALARSLKRSGTAITLLLSQPSVWQPQLERAGVVFVAELDGLEMVEVLALCGTHLALSLSESTGDSADTRLALAHQSGLALFAPAASGLLALGAHDANRLRPYFPDSVFKT